MRAAEHAAVRCNLLTPAAVQMAAAGNANTTTVDADENVRFDFLFLSCMQWQSNAHFDINQFNIVYAVCGANGRNVKQPCMRMMCENVKDCILLSPDFSQLSWYRVGLNGVDCSSIE